MQAIPLIRSFSFLGQRLPDPDAKLTPEEVKAFFSTQYPEVTTATITGPEVVGDKLVYTFSRSIGTKG